MVESALTTLGLCLASSAIAVVLGIPLGFWIASQREVVRLWLYPILAIPFFLPSLVLGLIFFPFLNRNETNLAVLFGLLAVVQGLMNVGFVGLTVQSSLSGIDPSQTESAQLDGASESQIAWQIELPQIRAALIAVSTLIALYSATNYSLALLIGRGIVTTIEIEIAYQAFVKIDYAAALTVGLVQTLLTAGLFLVSQRISQQPVGLSLFSSGSPETLRKRSSRDWPIQVFGLLATAVTLVGVVSPIARSLSSSGGFSLDNYSNLLTRGERSILDVSVVEAASNSLRNLLMTMLIAIPLAIAIARMTGRGRLVTRALGVAPAAISPVVLGLISLVAASQLGIRATEAWVLLPLAQSLVVIPLLTLLFSSAYDSLDRELLDAAEMDGAHGLRRFLLIELPTLRAPLLTGLMFGSLSTLGEFSAASFFAVGSQTTLPLALYQLASRPGAENLGMAMAVASILILISASAIVMQRRLARS